MIALTLLLALSAGACGSDGNNEAAGKSGQPAIPGVEAPNQDTGSPAPAPIPDGTATPDAAPQTPAPDSGPSGSAVAPSVGGTKARGATGNLKSGPASASAAAPNAAAAPTPSKSGSQPAPSQPVPGRPTPGQPGPGQVGSGGAGGATDVGVTANEIRIGMLSELSGPIAIYGQSFPKAAQAFFNDRNEKGGIHGRQLKLIVYDDGWDPVKGKAGTKRLIEQDKVFALCCTQSMNTNGAIVPYLDEVKVPHIGVDGLNEEQYKGVYTFPIGTSLAPLAEIWAPYAYNVLGARKVAIASLTVSGGPQYRDTFEREFTKLGGQVVYKQDFDIDAADFSSFALQARSKGADSVTGFLEIVTSIRMMQAAQQQGWKPEKGYAWNTASYVNVFTEYLGDYANGTYVQSHLLAFETPSAGLDEFNKIVGRYYDLKSLTYSPWLPLTGVAAKLTIDAIDSQGPNLTREGVKNYLEHLTNWDTKWGVKLTFRPGTGDARRSNTSAQFIKVVDKKWVPQGGMVEAPSYKKAG